MGEHFLRYDDTEPSMQFNKDHMNRPHFLGRTILGDWSKRGGKDKVFKGLAGLLRVIYEGNSKEQPCQPEESPVLPDSFTQMYILFLIGFQICISRIHRRFHISLPKIHRRFRIFPPNSVMALLNLYLPSWIRICPSEMHRRGIMMYPVYYKKKTLKTLFEILWTFHEL